MLMPKMGVREPAISRATRSIVPSPPNTTSKSTWRARVAASAQTTAFKRASRIVAGSLYILRPAATIRLAARLTATAPETFSEFPISPTRLILSARALNQHQEFFVASGAKHRGFGDAQPPQVAAGGDELVQLAQHALVNCRIADYARTPVSLGLAGFELRFNQRDDLSGWPKQCNGGRENLSEGDEGAVDYRQVWRHEGRRELRRRQRAGIGFLHYHHAGIAAQFPGKLALAHVHRIHFGSATLQQAVGKAASRGADVNRRLAGDIEVEVIKSVFELKAATTDKLLGCGQGELVFGLDGIAGFAG